MLSPNDILKQYWGHDAFRDLQLEIINATLNKNDVLALLPTGGGKSICFQVPAICMEGICLVISPLIALMKDQVENLRNKKIPAAAIYSGMSKREIETTFNNAVNGAYKFLYLSPERLQNEDAQSKIAQMSVNLLAVDEAHCVSQWGYDFRPEYLLIANIRQIIKEAPILALTASATAAVVEDIQLKLNFKKNLVFRKSFERKNLQYVVRGTDDKYNKVLEICNKIKGSGLIYANNRRQTQELASWLRNNKIDSFHYHAGLNNKERNKIQEDWIKNKIRVIVCTNAFGMGIDKPDVRFVIHYQMPVSLEAYYQEAGRAGRDGQRSFCVVLHHPTDEKNARSLLELKYTPIAEVRRVYELISNYLHVPLEGGFDQSYDFELAAFCKATQLNPLMVNSALKTLEQNQLMMASQSFYSPSKLQLLADSNTLYQYQLKNQFHDAIIKTIVRSYGGIFDYYININEKEIAARTPNSTEAKVIACLQQLHQLKFADYVVQTDSPKIIFLTARLPSKHLEIDEKLQVQLKQNDVVKINSAFEYANQTQNCRSQKILIYFDEIKTLPCGVCDVCLNYFKDTLPKEKFNAIHFAINEIVHKQPSTLTSLLGQLKFQKNEIEIVLKYLFSNELLKYNKDQKIALT